MVQTCKKMMTRVMTVLIGLGSYLRRIAIALSVLTNVVLGGSLNQTLSARQWEWKRQGRPNLVWFIDSLLGKNHCMMCWSYWKTRGKW